jgi:hypothetical protein
MSDATAPKTGAGDSNATSAEIRLASLKPHERRRAQKDQAEANEHARLQTPAEIKKRRKESQRHIQLKLISAQIMVSAVPLAGSFLHTAVATLRACVNARMPACCSTAHMLAL